MKDYEVNLITRNIFMEGHSPWYGIQGETGGWWIPIEDWELHSTNYKKYVKKWGVVIQAGGCQGVYPRLFADMFERVYTFEPDPLNFICLVNNCQKDNIFKMQAALGEKCRLIKIIRRNSKNSGENSILLEGDCYIPMITIDTLNLDRCDLIQLDIESFEENAIRGALKTIKKYKPVISCENGNDSIMKMLKPFGYTLATISHKDSFYVVEGS